MNRVNFTSAAMPVDTHTDKRVGLGNGDDFFVATQLTSRHSYKVRFKTTSCSDRKDDYGVLEYNPN